MRRVADSSARSRILAASARPFVSGMRASSSTKAPPRDHPPRCVMLALARSGEDYFARLPGRGRVNLQFPCTNHWTKVRIKIVGPLQASITKRRRRGRQTRNACDP